MFPQGEYLGEATAFRNCYLCLLPEALFPSILAILAKAGATLRHPEAFSAHDSHRGTQFVKADS